MAKRSLPKPVGFYVDRGYTGDKPAVAAREYGIKLAQVKRGFVLLPRLWVAECTFAWSTRFRRLVRDYERLPQTLADLHVIAWSAAKLLRSEPC